MKDENTDERDRVALENLKELMEPAIPPGWDKLDLIEITFDRLKELDPVRYEALLPQIADLSDRRFEIWEKFHRKRNYQFEQKVSDFIEQFMKSKKREIEGEALKRSKNIRLEVLTSNPKSKVKVESLRAIPLVLKEVTSEFLSEASRLSENMKNHGPVIYTKYEHMLDHLRYKIRKTHRNLDDSAIDDIAHTRLFKLINSGKKISLTWWMSVKAIDADGLMRSVRGINSWLTFAAKNKPREKNLIGYRSMRSEIALLKGEWGSKPKPSMHRQIEIDKRIKFLEASITYYYGNVVYSDGVENEPAPVHTDCLQTLTDDQIVVMKTLSLKQVERIIKQMNIKTAASRNRSSRVKYKTEAKDAWDELQKFLIKVS